MLESPDGPFGNARESGTDLVKLSFLKKRTAAVCAQRANDFLLKSTSFTKIEPDPFYGRKLDNEVGGNTVKRVEKRLLLLIAKALVPLCWPFLAFITLTHFIIQFLPNPPISFQDLHNCHR